MNESQDGANVATPPPPLRLIQSSPIERATVVWNPPVRQSCASIHGSFTPLTNESVSVLLRMMSSDQRSKFPCPSNWKIAAPSEMPSVPLTAALMSALIVAGLQLAGIWLQ